MKIYNKPLILRESESDFEDILLVSISDEGNDIFDFDEEL